MENKTINTLISKFFRNELSEEIQKKFCHWFVNGSFQKEKGEALELLWKERTEVADAKTYEELADIHSRMESLSPTRIGKKRSLSVRLLRVAAILLVPLIGAFSTYLYMEKAGSEKEVEWINTFTANGEQKEIRLPDGSNVWINSGSLLIYAKEFKSKKRTIFLNGEAIFDVAADPQRPFIVKTHYMDVEALGTRFNVEAYLDSEYTTTTLESGNIRVYMEGKEPVLVEPDQQIQLQNQAGTFIKETVDAGRVLQWQHGYITFQKASFDYIVQTLQRRYDMTINYEESRFAGRRYNLKIHPEEDLRETLDILQEMIPDLKYKVDGNIVYVY